MRTTVPIASIALLALALPAAGAPLADKVPADALVYIGWAGSRNLTFDGSMLGQLLHDPAAGAIVEALEKASADQAGPEARKAVAAALALAGWAWRSPLAVAVLDLPDPKKDAPPPLAVLIDVGKDRTAFEAQVNQLLGSLGKKVKRERATAGSATYELIHLGPAGPPIGYGAVGDVVFFCIGPDTPAQLLQLAPDKALKANKKFAACLKEVGGENEQLAFYADATALVAKAEKIAPAGPPREGEPPKNVVRTIVDALGLAEADALAGTVRVVDRGLYTKTRLFTPAPHRGVLLPLAGQVLGPQDLEGLPADADYVAAARVSAKSSFAELRNLFKLVADPGDAKEFDEKWAKLEKRLGFSVADDLLEHLGDTWTISSAASQGGFLTGTLLTVTVKDPARLAVALGKLEVLLLHAVGEAAGQPDSVRIEKIRSDRVEIKYIAGAGLPMPVAPAWAVHKKKLYVALWPQVIQAAAANGRGPGLDKSPDFAAARQRVSPRPTVLTYTNTPKIVRQVYNLLLVGWTMGSSMAIGQGVPAKPDWLPPLSSIEKYLWPEVSAVSVDAKGITFEEYGSVPLPILSRSPAGTMLASAILLPSVISARGKAREVASMSNLRGIGMGIAMYECDEGRLPPDLAALIKHRSISESHLVSPLSKRPPPRMVDGKLVGEVDYIYILPVAGVKGDDIVAYERPENHGGRRTIILLRDCSVRKVGAAELQRKLQRLRDLAGKPDK